MSFYKKYIYKSLKSLDELHEVMVDAYRRGIVLHYCFKCFITFLTIEERQHHDRIHKNQSNIVCSPNKNNPNKPVNEAQYNNSSYH